MQYTGPLLELLFILPLSMYSRIHSCTFLKQQMGWKSTLHVYQPSFCRAPPPSNKHPFRQTKHRKLVCKVVQVFFWYSMQFTPMHPAEKIKSVYLSAFHTLCTDINGSKVITGVLKA